MIFAQAAAMEEKSERAGKRIPELNIGMVGHVDHGKTSLTAALTGKWTDTHSEEIKRGITIRLGYAEASFYRCGQCAGHEAYGTAPVCAACGGQATLLRTVSFVDAPGHETLMATVLAGAAIMDGALLIISANEACPQPQTREHLTALQIVGIKNIVVVQTKIDLVSEEEALRNHQQIAQFLKGTMYERAPVIPVSAQQSINLGAVVEAIEKHIPTPKRDASQEPLMLVARSFDVNRPGTPIESLEGGVVGGSLVQGRLSVGDEVEIRPGVNIKSAFRPLRTKITGMRQAGSAVGSAGPGGLLGISTLLDPSLTKSDSLGGNVVGLPGRLPPVLNNLSLTVHLLERVVGSREEFKVEPVRPKDILMLTVLTTRVIGTVMAVKGDRASVSLKFPVCAHTGAHVAVSKQILGRWRLVGWGEII